MTSNPKLFTQEIDETTQPEKVTELVKQAQKDLMGAIQGLGFVGTKDEDGNLVWTYDENIEKLQDKDPLAISVFGLNEDVTGLEYDQIVQRIAKGEKLHGVTLCEIVMMGSQVEAETHTVRIERTMGCAPFLVPRRFGSFSGLNLANVQSLVFVYELPTTERKSFVCAFSNLTVEKHETWCVADGGPPTENIHISADNALPWRMV